MSNRNKPGSVWPKWPWGRSHRKYSRSGATQPQTTADITSRVRRKGSAAAVWESVKGIDSIINAFEPIDLTGSGQIADMLLIQPKAGWLCAASPS
jgi:hypothetical protein